MGRGKKSIFTDKEKKWIRRMYDSGQMTVNELAEHFNCSGSQIYNAKRPPRESKPNKLQEKPLVNYDVRCHCPRCSKNYTRKNVKLDEPPTKIWWKKCERCERSQNLPEDRDITKFTRKLRAFNRKHSTKGVTFAEANGIGGW